jgi:tetratricopeptide (TPR) repeat protein
MPDGVAEGEWLTAVAGLENAGQWQAAASGYSAALKRWNKSFVAWMGLGNSAYNLHDLDASAGAFHQATLLQPQNGMAFNNLAHVLAEQGRLQEALTAAQRAVDLGGPFIDIFRQTLEEVKLIPLVPR